MYKIVSDKTIAEKVFLRGLHIHVFSTSVQLNIRVEHSGFVGCILFFLWLDLGPYEIIVCPYVPM